MKIELNPVDIEIISTVAPIRVDSEELRGTLKSTSSAVSLAPLPADGPRIPLALFAAGT